MNKIIGGARVTIEKLVPGGQGIATLPDGKKAFFWNALPGEIVTEYEVFKQKSKYLEAVALKTENLSPERTKPKDNIALSTSPWQIMNYDFELNSKLELLKESFRQEGLENHEFLPVVTDGKEYFYRNKMEYSLYWDIAEECIKLAFRKRGTHRKIVVKSSSLERPEIYAKAREIVADLNARHEEARKYQSLLLRANQNGEVSGGLFENHQPHPSFSNLTDTLLGREYSYSPNGFFQINLPVYELALKEIAKHIKTEKVLDLYAGVGTIGLSVARDKDLTLVEVNKDAFYELTNNISRARASGADASIAGRAEAGRPNQAKRDPRISAGKSVATDFPDAVRDDCIKAVCAKSEEALDYIQPDQTVILDPPRAGCDQKLLEKLLAVKPQSIIYLSCNPATQARDLKILTEKYKIEKIQPFNFFPRTPHLENLVVLSVVQ